MRHAKRGTLEDRMELYKDTLTLNDCLTTNVMPVLIGTGELKVPPERAVNYLVI